MNFAQFSEEYKRRVDLLKKAKKQLKLLLEQCLEAYQKQMFFRPRLVEARVKSPISLWDKIKNRGLAPDDAFDTEKVTDLIGARIVCHNLLDLEEVVQTLQRNADLLRIVDKKNLGREKEINQGDKTGYRGMHREVIWKYEDTEYVGELQIRTILQDAWASFMHDDIYEHGIRDGIPQHLPATLRSASDLFFSIDQMANALRESMSQFGISFGTSLKWGLLGMVGWLSSDLRSSRYATIVRSDVYRIQGVDGEYDITVEQTLPPGNSRPFKIFLSGDTIAEKNASVTEVIDLSSNENILKDRSRCRVDLNSRDLSGNLLAITDRRRRKTHKYRIKCRWRGTFAQPLHYLHIPWRSYYGIGGRYRLELISDRDYASEPKLYTFDEANLALDRFATDGVVPASIGVPGTFADGRHSWDLTGFNEDAMVVWANEPV